MRINKKSWINTHVWQMLVIVTILITVLGYLIVSGIVSVLPGTENCEESISLNISSLLGIVVYIGIIVWAMKQNK